MAADLVLRERGAMPPRPYPASVFLQEFRINPSSQEVQEAAECIKSHEGGIIIFPN